MVLFETKGLLKIFSSNFLKLSSKFLHFSDTKMSMEIFRQGHYTTKKQPNPTNPQVPNELRVIEWVSVF